MSKKKPAEFYSAVDQLLDQQEFVESIKMEFGGLHDPRVLDKKNFGIEEFWEEVFGFFVKVFSKIDK